jgi:hypothetical protein
MDKPNTTSLKDEIEKEIVSKLKAFGFEGADRKCFTPKHGDGAYTMERWDENLLASVLSEPVLQAFQRVVEEAEPDKPESGGWATAIENTGFEKGTTKYKANMLERIGVNDE